MAIGPSSQSGSPAGRDRGEVVSGAHASRTKFLRFQGSFRPAGPVPEGGHRRADRPPLAGIYEGELLSAEVGSLARS
jgi:hypothetical protein